MNVKKAKSDTALLEIQVASPLTSEMNEFVRMRG